MRRSPASVFLTALACGALSGCATGSGEDGDCVSHYDPVATAPTWAALKNTMLDYTTWGRAASVRTQARGKDSGAGDEDVVRVVDLLNVNGRRLIQVDVWRTADGAWSAGVWEQCTD